MSNATPENYLATPDGQLALLVLLHNLKEQVKIPFRTILCTPQTTQGD